MAKPQEKSKTSEVAAAARAHHLRSTNHPIFADSFAYSLCGNTWQKILDSKLIFTIVDFFVLRHLRPIATEVVVRARYCEDRVVEAVNSGIDQYVILGAGLDSFAMRRTELADRVTVFELDQTVTQEDKRTKMRANNIPEPGNVRYICADLNKVDLFDALTENGFSMNKKTIFSWFGVTYYLPLDTNKSTLENIAGQSAEGSEILFDYLSDDSNISARWQKVKKKCIEFVNKRGEPWICGFEPTEIARWVESCGFAQVDNLTPAEIGDRYFAAREDQLEFPPIFGFIRAVVR